MLHLLLFLGIIYIYAGNSYIYVLKLTRALIYKSMELL